MPHREQVIWQTITDDTWGIGFHPVTPANAHHGELVDFTTFTWCSTGWPSPDAARLAHRHAVRGGRVVSLDDSLGECARYDLMARHWAEEHLPPVPSRSAHR